MRNTQALAAMFFLCSCVSATAQSVEVAMIVPPRLEGPATDFEGNVFLADLPSDTILRMTPAGVSTPFRRPANRANGLAIDAQNRLLAAERGDADRKSPGRITRTNLQTGQVEVL